MVNLGKGKKEDESPKRRGVSLAKPAPAAMPDPAIPAARAAESINPEPVGQSVGGHPAEAEFPTTPFPATPFPTTPYRPSAALPPPVGSPSPGPPPLVRGSKPWYRRGAALVAIGTALALIAVLVALSLGGSGGNPSTPAADLPTVRSTVESTEDVSAQSSEPSGSPLPESTSPAPPVIPSVTPGGINIAAVRTNPHVAAVADLFDRYLAATNAHDGSNLVEIFDPAGVTKSDTADGIAKWQAEVVSSFDDEMVLTAIRDYPAVPGGLLVHAAFRSQQDPNLGPDGQSCTHWDLVFRLTPYADSYRVLDAQQVQPVAC